MRYASVCLSLHTACVSLSHTYTDTPDGFDLRSMLVCWYVRVSIPLVASLSLSLTHNSDGVNLHDTCYGVATISRLLKITGLFCRISSLL